MESIALLTNLLRATVTASPKVKPSRATLNAMFKQYQDRRIPRMHKVMEFSNMITRIQAWDGRLMKLVATCVLPYQHGKKLGEQIGEIINGGEKLNFVPIKRRPGRINWDDDVDGNEQSGVVVEVARGGTIWKERTSAISFILVFLSVFWAYYGISIGASIWRSTSVAIFMN